MDPIEALLNPTADNEEEMAALANSLRGKKRAADFFSLSTIDPISQMAQGSQGEIMDSAKQQGMLRKARAQRLAEDERARLGRESREGISARNIANDLAMAEMEFNQGPGELTRLTEYYRKGGSGRPVQVGQDEFGNARVFGTNAPFDPEKYELALSPSELENQMGKFRADESDAVQIAEQFRTIDDLLQPYTKGGDKKRPFKKVPGVGRLSGKPGLIGETARLAETELEGEPAGELIFSAIRGLFNVKLREGAGLSQTKQEMEKLREEFGGRLLTDPVVARDALKRIRRKYNADLKVMAKANPQVLGEYQSRLGEDETPFYEGALEFLEFPDGGGPSLLGDLFKGRPSGGMKGNVVPAAKNYEGMTEAELDAELAR